MAESRARAGKEASAGNGAGPEPAPAERACSVALCPIGMTLNTMQQSRPDMIEHLLLAGREFLLAAKAVIDARAADVEERPSTLERIEIS